MATTEAASQCVDSVDFSFMTAEEVRKHSCVKITNRYLLDPATNTPLRGGLYDPSLGPYSDREICQRCGQRYANCPGHFGHVDLVLPIYNPLLFNFLSKILKVICLFCHQFRAPREQIEKYVSQLQLISKGDIIGSRSLDSFVLDSSSEPAESDVSHEPCSSVSSMGCHDGVEEKKEWTSIQFTEAMSVFRNVFKVQSRKCKLCGKLNPTISKPIAGWFHMGAMKGIDVRANIINSHKRLAGAWEGISDAKDPGASVAGKSTGKRKTVKESLGAEELGMLKGVSARELLPSEVKDILEILWEKEAPFCTFLTDIQSRGSGLKHAGASMFFLETVLVTPIKFRPPAKAGDSSKMMDHPQTALLAQVVESNVTLGNAIDNKENSKIIRGWLGLQQSVNILFDGKTAKGSGQKDVSSGICQLLEKKEGLFRQKMMGKRVNYACRSVISPDPYLGVNEIGIPPCFAVKLTYPERVTPWCAAKLRSYVINGPEVHPGATHYVDKYSVNKLPPSRKLRLSIARKLQSSRGSMQAEKVSDQDCEGKIVYRHVRDGDVVLVNRQPTLHKPSIMAHVVRVLKGEKTLRMHYANCSTYNADFDGDEMNVHLPQDEISRAEAYNIVNANNQYVRPSNGEPLRSLIQDHIVSATLLTNRNTFLSREQFNQLLYVSGVCKSRSISHGRKLNRSVLHCLEDEIQMDGWPAIIKPTPMWTGKQVITAILNHLLRGKPPFTVEKGGKISEEFFKERTGKIERSKEAFKTNEDKLLIKTNDLIRGVIDKAQFGEYGLVHTIQELYGSDIAGVLLTIFSRLFTAYLQMHGFTCGVDDLLIKKDMDMERDKVFEKCGESGVSVHKRFIGLKDDKIQIGPEELQLHVEKIIRGDGEAASNYLDRQMSNELNSITSSRTIGRLLSDGLLKPSGKNCISLMTASGAKGSKVNFQQISSLLGQQELEGKRVPRMVSGKTLPCFSPWDWEPRAGGYISDRFLSGLRPQEYYFHCMAGREGLVDTAVKTSRSGYLQRCLIKNMEALKVSYDHTVRDADGSIIQFRYGEDGVDVHRTSFISNFDALAANRDIIFKTMEGSPGSMGTYICNLPLQLEQAAKRYLENCSLNERIASGFVKHDDFLRLVKHKFLQSVAQPGEPVGVLAAQSVGEPSTQMTLNTFHLAGRGEMNVTLGIPRLQEILMTAANEIKTPIMTCPLINGSKREAADRLADKLKKITVADITKTMEVSMLPFAVHDDVGCRLYKLRMKLYKPAHYPKNATVTIEKWEETLEVDFVRQLEDAIQNHLVLLSKISGIKDFLTDSSVNETGEDSSGNESSRRQEEDDDNDHDENEGLDDLGSDAQKRKMQAVDEMDYDDFRGEASGGESSSDVSGDSESEIDDNDTQSRTETAPKGESSEKSSSMPLPESKNTITDDSVAKSRQKGKSSEPRQRVLKRTDKAIYVHAKDMRFEVHFKFTDEPHILLAEIAKKVAKNVYIQNPGKIEQCRVTNCKESQVIYHGEDPKIRADIVSSEKEKIPALHATGIDFNTFWKMQDHLDVRYIYSNSIHAMLNTYGVEAARETIIKEVNHVFKSYGIAVSTRHLSLIADYMTFAGDYRPMSRLGGIADSTSPFSKMSFETASKFIVQAALHGQQDALETPSARICLGLPVKMGTGSFDLVQNFDFQNGT